MPCLAQDLVRALLLKDAGDRLGCGDGGSAAVKAHPFLAAVDWDALTAGCMCSRLDVHGTRADGWPSGSWEGTLKGAHHERRAP